MPEPTVRAGTCNVRSLPGRLGAVSDMAANAGVNILCLQETKLSVEGVHSIRQYFRAKGWHFLHGPLDFDAAGKSSGGVAIVADWPVELLDIPASSSFPSRVMAVKAHRPGQRPLLVINAYFPANDDPLNQFLTEKIIDWVANTGEDYVILGDWNREQKQQPLCGMIAAGAVNALDTDPSFGGVGTHRLECGTYTGRVIDYGISSMGVSASARMQCLGPADHDLVAYDIPLKGTRRGWKWQPRRKLHKDVELNWAEVWGEAAEYGFQDYVREGNAEMAWRLLSDTVENAFASDDRRAKPRGVPGKPVLTEAHAIAPPTVQTLKERKLRRAARRLMAVIHQERRGDGDTGPAKTKLQRYIQHIVDAYPDLSDLAHFQGEEQLAFLQYAAEAEEERSNKARLEGWKDKVKADVPRLARWIKASVADKPSSMDNFAEDPDPQAKADRALRTWSQLWSQAGRPDGSQLRALLARLDMTTVPAAMPHVGGHSLLRRARAASRKAAGCDGWAGRHWCGLPLGFFHKLADVWNMVLEGASIPASWTQVRVCLIDKEDGGQRPLAIAALAWRLGASVVVQKLASWIKLAFPEELYGGLPERCIEDVHTKLTQALFVQRGGGALAGCKADVRKCFDTADPKLAILCLRQLGAPDALLDVIGRFYDEHSRWLMVEGVCATRPVDAAAALLQGCPFSPLCLNAMMCVWLAVVKEANTQCELAVFLDDRTMWIRRRRGSVQSLCRAMQAGAVADEALGFTLHPNKLESFGTTQAVRDALLEAAHVVGVPQVTFTLLGIPYNSLRTTPVATASITDKLERRCKRIQICGQCRALRKALLAKLVIPLFRWCSPWVRHYKKLLARWAGAIERAVWGGAILRGRSRALAWSTLVGMELLPEYVAAETTILREHRRLHLRKHAKEAPCTKAAFDYFGWRRDGDVWRNRQGAFQAGAVGATGLRRMLRSDGVHKLFKNDPKVKQEGGFAGDFDLTFHLGAANRVEGYQARVMVGGATDARHVTPKGGDVMRHTCDCGQAGPTRTHMTFDCERKPWGQARRTMLERRLLLPLRASPPIRDVANYENSIAESCWLPGDL